MKALSILQPWAWLITRPDITDHEERKIAYLDGRIKNIENRTWRTPFRGRVLVHAGKKLPKREYADHVEDFADFDKIELPTFNQMKAMTGGIIGAVTITDCVADHQSKWKNEGWGFVLADATPYPFIPYRGQLGFFDVDGDVVRTAWKEYAT